LAPALDTRAQTNAGLPPLTEITGANLHDVDCLIEVWWAVRYEAAR